MIKKVIPVKTEAIKRYSSSCFFLILLCLLIFPCSISIGQQTPEYSDGLFENYRPAQDVQAEAKFEVRIATLTDVGFGTLVEVPVTLNNGAYRLGGYDLLIQYDPSVLSFSSADPGQLITDCGWEYFTYLHGASGNCGSKACPSGKLRIVAVAETNNGANHPLCFGETPAASNDLAILHFLVTNDYTMECQYLLIEFVWYDCFDNTVPFDTLSSGEVRRDRLAGPKAVFSNGLPLQPDSTFPTGGGLRESCFESDSLSSLIDFYNGGFQFPCHYFDDRGDVNLNGIANELADAELFSNYFIQGLKVFVVNVAGQIAACDVNRDGEPLKLEDLVYLERIIEGNAPPVR